MLRLATRQSPLALWQAHFVKQQLNHFYPQLQIELVGLVTAGDRHTDKTLTQLGGKSLFVKELQTALLEKTADIAVHSTKDLAAASPPGLLLAAVCKREDPRDALLAPGFSCWQELPFAAVIGTSSPRRQCQLLAHRPDLLIHPLRGNVGTRLAKLDNGDFTAIVLAAAGLIRLGSISRITQYLEPQEFIPAIGQGALAIECRADDLKTRDLLSVIDDWATHRCVGAERAVNLHLGGDCYTPIGAYAEIREEQLTLRAMIGSMDGRTLLKAESSGNSIDAEHIGLAVAEKLLQQGAARLCQKF